MCYGGCNCKRCMGPDEERTPMINHMTWTTNKPTQPGWYWYKDIGADGSIRGIDILQIFWEASYGKDNEYGGYWAWLVDSSEHERVDALTGEWAGPLPEPTERDERETQP